MKRAVDYIGVGIGAVIIKNGKLFLSKRGKKSQNEEDKWELPGGAMEYGESFEQTVIREIREEFGFTIKPIEWLEPFNHFIPKEQQHWVALCFICEVVKGIPRIKEPDKSSEIGWYSIEEMEKMDLALPSQKRLKQLKQKYPKGLPF